MYTAMIKFYLMYTGHFNLQRCQSTFQVRLSFLLPILLPSVIHNLANNIGFHYWNLSLWPLDVHLNCVKLTLLSKPNSKRMYIIIRVK